MNKLVLFIIFTIFLIACVGYADNQSSKSDILVQDIFSDVFSGFEYELTKEQRELILSKLDEVTTPEIIEEAEKRVSLKREVVLGSTNRDRIYRAWILRDYYIHGTGEKTKIDFSSLTDKGIKIKIFDTLFFCTLPD
jgi:hypothetical protein